MAFGSLASPGSWPRCGELAGPGRTVLRVQSCTAFLALLGRRLSDQRRCRVRWMRRGPPWDPSVHIKGVWS